MSEYFPNAKSLGANVKVELDLLDYATKTDLRNATDVVISDLAKKTDSAHKLDIDKLKNLPSNLSNLKSKGDKKILEN